MKRVIPFAKMHGLGNDYIYVDVTSRPLPDPERLALLWSDRRKGIGSDGLILIGASDEADFSMRVFNADGSEARMCGNGIRCVGKYVYDKGLTSKTDLRVETLSGIRDLRLSLGDDGLVRSVTVDMGLGTPLLVHRPGGEQNKLVGEEVTVSGVSYTGTAICMGNPHLVLQVPDAESAAVERDGSLLEVSPLFPDKVNVEFAQVLDRTHVRMRVWERGSGVTWACGTGACATAVALAMAGKVDPEGTEIRMDGGALTVRWDPADKRTFMTGEATMVYEGQIACPE